MTQRTSDPLELQACQPSVALSRTRTGEAVVIRKETAETRLPSCEYEMLVGSTPLPALAALAPVMA